MDDDQELRDGLTKRKLHVERILRRSSYGWTQPRRDQDGVGTPCDRPRLKKDGNYSGPTLILDDAFAWIFESEFWFIAKNYFQLCESVYKLVPLASPSYLGISFRHL